jgi:hypothetical protein
MQQIVSFLCLFLKISRWTGRVATASDGEEEEARASGDAGKTITDAPAESNYVINGNFYFEIIILFFVWIWKKLYSILIWIRKKLFSSSDNFK